MITGFEQFVVGQTFTSPPRPLEAAEIKAFAAQFDFQPQHIDEKSAEGTMFGSLAASGWHTASLTMRLMLESALQGVSGRGLGVRVNDITWSAPVRPGDRLYAVSEVTELRPSRSKPDRGIVVLRTVTYNQHDQAVQEMTGTLMILRTDAVATPMG
jgi:acyl dehydratase